MDKTFMENYDFYDPLKHNGYLPVRVLRYNFLEWFQSATPDFINEINYESESNGFSPLVGYNINRIPIKTVAEIDSQKRIILYENYNQFLWCLSYALIVIYDENIMKPLMSNRYTGKFDLNNVLVRKALDIYSAGLSLFFDYRDSYFYNLPNPEKFSENDSFNITAANGVFTSAMTFVLLHEFGHQYFGHLDVVSADKADEITADEFAFSKLETQFNTDKGATLKIGIVVGLCSLMFLDSTMKGGDFHPDPDDRLKNIIEKLQLKELDNTWGIASLALKLWSIGYNVEMNQPTVVKNYKELFYYTLDELKKYKYNS